jgi:hypothetical protein
LGKASNVRQPEDPPLTPALSPQGRGKREPIFMVFELEFDSIFSVAISLENNSVSPLYPVGRGLG